jgi:hypothetical protein
MLRLQVVVRVVPQLVWQFFVVAAWLQLQAVDQEVIDVEEDKYLNNYY